MRTREEVIKEFTPVEKIDIVQKHKLLSVEVAYRELAKDVADLVPEGAHRTAALRKLLESKMTCVQAITHAQQSSAQAPASPKVEQAQVQAQTETKEMNSGKEKGGKKTLA